MDWFEAITGFKERGYDETRSMIDERDGFLVSRRTNRRSAVGTFLLPSLAELRKQRGNSPSRGGLSVRNVSGDIRAMHAEPQYRGALFQVASQFNMLEMVAPHVTPEEGVTIYRHDPTQGPACAIAAGAATIYRNYLVPIGDQRGQTADRQLDGLAGLGQRFSELSGLPVSGLWDMRNGYALATRRGLKTISSLLSQADSGDREELMGLLRIGLHENAEVTLAEGEERPQVSQAFCSALPVAYSDIEAETWEPFARFILEAAYEAALLAGLRNMRRGHSRKVLLTRLGGGAFGNGPDWIDGALCVALEKVADEDLEILLVNHGPPPENMVAIERRFAGVVGR